MFSEIRIITKLDNGTTIDKEVKISLDIQRGLVRHERKMLFLRMTSLCAEKLFEEELR
jgi:hypothetical protein